MALLLQRSVERIAAPNLSIVLDLRRTTQAAAYLLEKSGKSMPLGRLMIMLYLSDREALGERRRPITYDAYAATAVGPVPIAVTHLFFSEGEYASVWSESIVREGEMSVLLKEVGDDQLSRHDRLMLNRTFDALNTLDLSSTLEYVADNCPEWLAHLGGLIPLEEVLVELGDSSEDARAIAAQIRAERSVRERRLSEVAA